MDVLDQHLGAEDEREADDHEQDLRREVDDRERDREPRRLLHADDVERDEHHDDDHAADDVPRVRPQRLPEDREVVRDEERRDGDRDDVDEHLRPARREAHELVERVPGEARRAPGLRKACRASGVRRGRRGEHDPGDDEDERRQPEGVDGRQAERVVDRGADVAVRGREERGRAEHALQLDLTPAAASGHGGEAYNDEGPVISLPATSAARDYWMPVSILKSRRAMRPRGTRTVGGVMPEPKRYRGATTVYAPGRSKTRRSTVGSRRHAGKRAAVAPKHEDEAGRRLEHGCASMQTGRVRRKRHEATEPEAGLGRAESSGAPEQPAPYTRRHIPRE